MTRDERMLNEHVAGCAAAHQLLLGSLDGLTDAECREPSKLPNWSRGHVLTHLARNADSHVHLLIAAGNGEIADQYPGGIQARSQAIEDGSNRTSDELVSDVRTSIYSLEAQWAKATPTTWEGEGRTARGAVIAMSDLVFFTLARSGSTPCRFGSRVWLEAMVGSIRTLGIGKANDDLAKSKANGPYGFTGRRIRTSSNTPTGLATGSS